MTGTLLLVKGLQLFASAARQSAEEGESPGAATPVARGLHEIAARLGDVSAGLDEIRGVLLNISKSIDELVAATSQVSDTLVSIAKNAPALKADGHLERAAKAIDAGLFDIALSELAEAEALDRTNYKLWLSYLVWRAGVASSGLTGSEANALLGRVAHGAEEELQNGTRLLGADRDVEPRLKLLLNYCFLALALLFGREEFVGRLAHTISSLLVSSRTLSLDNAPLFLGPLERLVARDDRDEVLGESLRHLRREYQGELAKVSDSWALRLQYPLDNYEYEKYRRVSERVQSIRGLLPPDDLAALGAFEEVYRATHDDSSALTALRKRRDEVAEELSRWSKDVTNSAGEMGKEQEAVTTKDLRWIGAVLVLPWVVAYFLPFRMLFSVPALYAVFIAASLLHRLIYNAPARKFERERRPALEEEEKLLNGQIAEEVSRLRDTLGRHRV